MDAFHFRFLIGPFCYRIIIEVLGHSQQLINNQFTVFDYQQFEYYLLPTTITITTNLAKIDLQPEHVYKVCVWAELRCPFVVLRASQTTNTQHMSCASGQWDWYCYWIGVVSDGMGLRLPGQQAPVPSGVAPGTLARLFALFTLRWRIV